MSSSYGYASIAEVANVGAEPILKAIARSSSGLYAQLRGWEPWLSADVGNGTNSTL